VGGGEIGVEVTTGGSGWGRDRVREANRAGKGGGGGGGVGGVCEEYGDDVGVGEYALRVMGLGGCRRGMGSGLGSGSFASCLLN